MGLADIMPVVAKICIWVCIAHFYIIICSIVYVELEGPITNSTKTLNKVNEFLTETFRGNTKLLTNQKSIEYLKFKEKFNEEIEDLHYWKMRNEFKDISKVYVFVLGLHTTVGSSHMYVQTSASKIFYCFTVPLGTLFYLLMLHSIVVEFFEVIALSAVSIFQQQQRDWSDDQRDLYAKLKCLLLVTTMLLLLYFSLSLLSLFTQDSYLNGLQQMMSLIITISYDINFIPYQHWEHHTVAAIMTFIYFLTTFTIYLFMYSVFILFRYNTLDEVIGLFYQPKDDLFDIITIGDSEYEAMGEKNKTLLYYQAKADAQQQQQRDVQQKVYKPHRRFPHLKAENLSDTPIASDDSSELKPPKQQHRRKKQKKLEKQESFLTDIIPEIEVPEASATSKNSILDIDSDTPIASDDSSELEPPKQQHRRKKQKKLEKQESFLTDIIPEIEVPEASASESENSILDIDSVEDDDDDNDDKNSYDILSDRDVYSNK